MIVPPLQDFQVASPCFRVRLEPCTPPDPCLQVRVIRRAWTRAGAAPEVHGHGVHREEQGVADSERSRGLLRLADAEAGTAQKRSRRGRGRAPAPCTACRRRAERSHWPQQSGHSSRFRDRLSARPRRRVLPCARNPQPTRAAGAARRACRVRERASEPFRVTPSRFMPSKI